MKKVTIICFYISLAVSIATLCIVLNISSKIDSIHKKPTIQETMAEYDRINGITSK